MNNSLVIKLPKFQENISISEEWIDQRNSLIIEASKLLKINSTETFDKGTELIRKITKTSNSLETMRKELGRPFNEANKLIKLKADEARKPLERIKKELQKKTGNFWLEQKKKEEEERKRIEDEQRKEIEQQFSEKEKLEEAGLIDKEEPFVPNITVQVPETETPKSHNARIHEDVEWEIYSEELIPNAFRSFDPRKLNTWLRENKSRVIQSLKEDPKKSQTTVLGINFKLITKVIGR